MKLFAVGHQLPILGLFLSLSHSAIAYSASDVLNLNPTGKGCVDPSGYLSCYAAQAVSFDNCMTLATSSCRISASALAECQLGCYGAYLAGHIGCWLQSCWNQVGVPCKSTWTCELTQWQQVYSCEYQGTAIQYLSGTDRIQETVSIPFYPAPEGAPGRCCKFSYPYYTSCRQIPDRSS
jgi:hypothetical protein